MDVKNVATYLFFAFRLACSLVTLACGWLTLRVLWQRRRDMHHRLLTCVLFVDMSVLLVALRYNQSFAPLYTIRRLFYNHVACIQCIFHIYLAVDRIIFLQWPALLAKLYAKPGILRKLCIVATFLTLSFVFPLYMIGILRSDLYQPHKHKRVLYTMAMSYFAAMSYPHLFITLVLMIIYRRKQSKVSAIDQKLIRAHIIVQFVFSCTNLRYKVIRLLAIFFREESVIYYSGQTLELQICLFFWTYILASDAIRGLFISAITCKPENERVDAADDEASETKDAAPEEEDAELISVDVV